MTIDEIKAEKNSIEREIAQRLNGFMEATGCVVNSVSIRTVDRFGIGSEPRKRVISGVTMMVELV